MYDHPNLFVRIDAIPAQSSFPFLAGWDEKCPLSYITLKFTESLGSITQSFICSLPHKLESWYWIWQSSCVISPLHECTHIYAHRWWWGCCGCSIMLSHSFDSMCQVESFLIIHWVFSSLSLCTDARWKIIHPRHVETKGERTLVMAI